jgi:SAM-dependent methyltransferase
MADDRYAGAAAAWARGASLVYAPLARQLAARTPHDLAGRLVLDLGAGTGVGSDALADLGARVVAADLSFDMLAHRASSRPPSLVASVLDLPVRDDSVDDVFAAFVFNHLTDPTAALRESARVVRRGGVVLASVYATSSRSASRDRVDAVAAAHGWTAPDWYVAMKRDAVPLLGDLDRMAATARAAGLHDIVAEETACDVGVTTPDDLVAYRFGQAHFSSWLGSLDAEAGRAVVREAVEAAGKAMEPCRPTVVFLAGVV